MQVREVNKGVKAVAYNKDGSGKLEAKRALYPLQKSPIIPPKKAYQSLRNAALAAGLVESQKSPTSPVKEPYIKPKRALNRL